jgi:glycosyltransferase involved in cell wall biosynthesis
MKKIKILFYSHTIDYGGTWRSHERTLLNLNEDLFDVYVCYNTTQDNNRLDYLKSKLNVNKLISFNSSKNKLGPDKGYSYVENNFIETIKPYNFDIIHFARSGYFEWPFIERICPIQIETNIFGGKDTSKFLDYSVSISNKVTNIRGSVDHMIYYPIPQPLKSNDTLISELNIPKDYHIFGRIGRMDNFHPISLLSLKKLKSLGLKFKYIIIGACLKTLNLINELDLKDDCIIIEVTNDDELIHRFNNTIDMFLHYRSDGETFGAAIAHAMMYGKPIISHFAGFNAQEEIIKDGGFVCKDENEYCEKILELCNDKEFYKKISSNAKKRALDFEEKKITIEWENLYKKLYNERFNNINLRPQ